MKRNTYQIMLLSLCIILGREDVFAGNGPAVFTHAIPGKIEVEEYDGGGEGVAYHDDKIKHGLNQFRPVDFVDVEKTQDDNGEYNIGWTHRGEWLQYTVHAEGGTYTPKIRAASALSGRILIQGRPQGGAQFKPLTAMLVNTGGISKWKTVEGTAFTLTEGVWELRLTLETGGVNLNWIEFVSGGAPTVDIPTLLTGKALEEKVDAVMQKMTFEEKARLCIGSGPLSFAGVPRLGIAAMNCGDGPRGPKHPQGTAFPAGPGQSATWNTELMHAMGEVWGKEARAQSLSVLLGPAFNILRDPLCGRFFEYYSEDPYLNGALVVPMVEGIQSRKVAACLKHFACNNRENNRNKYMSNVDERTLREIYLPAFKMGVDAGAWTVMTGANGANGFLLSDNKRLLTDILKQEWGFDGFVLTDWCGTRSTELAANAGLDVSMPWMPNSNYATHLFGQPLLDAVKAGRVPAELVEDKARRVLRVAARTGILDNIPASQGGAVNLPEHHAVARQVARESTVLLKNNGMLPLDRSRCKKILVVGPNANAFFCGGGLGGSSWVSAVDEVTALRGIREAAGDGVQIATFSLDDLMGFRPVTADDLVPNPDGSRGFKAEYRKQPGGAPVYRDTVERIDFVWEMRSPDPARLGVDHFNVKYLGQINPPVSGLYTLQIRADDRARLGYREVGGAPLAACDISSGSEATASVYMEKGKPYTVCVNYEEVEGDAFCQLNWALPGDNPAVAQALAQLCAAAAEADAVVFVGGLNHGQDTEGHDRTDMKFPPAQTRIIKALTAANPKTAVVLINGSPMELGEWLGDVPAVLESWYNGEAAGTVIGEILFGDINPSGKLPFTWPNSLEETPAHAVGTQDKDRIDFKEGIFVGYRYYDKVKLRPQFAFGYGLSYTTFAYEKLTVKPGDSTEFPMTATVTLKNSGKLTGKEVVQVYVSTVGSPVEQVAKELAGFTKVELKPGESRTVEIPLNRLAFECYDVAAKKWVRDSKFIISVGGSSDTLLVQTEACLPFRGSVSMKKKEP